MTRAEYMEKLAQGLKDYDEDFALDIIGDYRRHFDEAAADGRSEESVCEELGNVDDFLRDIPEEFKKKDSEQQERGSQENSDFTDDFGKLADDFGKFVNEAGKMAGKAGKAAGKAAMKAAKSADSAISKLSEVIADKINEAVNKQDEDSDDFDEEQKFDDDFSVNGESGENNFEQTKEEKESSTSEGAESDDYGMNPLIVCSYTGITALKMSVVEPNVELNQGDTQAVTITMSRPLTKKEKMSMSPVVTVEDGVLKFKQENKNRVFSFINTASNEPLIYYVTVPAEFEKINIATVSGYINVQSDIVTESCKLSTVSGSVKVENGIHADKLKISAVSGSIKVSAPLDAKKQELSTVSGSVKAVIEGDNFSAETVSGSVKLSVGSPCDGKVSTVSGSIVINLLSDIGIDIKSSGMSGSMKLMTDKHVVWNNGEDNNHVRFGFSKADRHATFGDGMARITTNSVSGSVKVYDFGKAE